ncbi:MAG: TonB C-terminal domain-containing protein [Deltaproteobacteria bacterium]|nr:TonB C-terminal domain-containing protein [Deltaproteobacteria bacterium]
MQGIVGQLQPGFPKMLAASFLLHLLVLLAVVFHVKTERKIFIVPAYTAVEVEIVTSAGIGETGGTGGTGKDIAGSKISIDTAGGVKAPDVKKTAPGKTVGIEKQTPGAIGKQTHAAKIKTKAAPPWKTVKVKAAPSKEKVSQEDKIGKAIASIGKRVKRREEDELVDLKIKGIKERLDREKFPERETGGIERTGGAGGTGGNIAGSRISIETARGTGGITRELFDIKFTEYYNAIGAKIQSLWVYPGKGGKDLQTVLNLKLLRSGELKSVNIEKNSGNTLFDESAINAVRKASPFPPLPEEIKEDFVEIGVRFCPGGCER